MQKRVRRRKKVNILPVLLIGFVVLALLGTGLWLYFMREKEPGTVGETDRDAVIRLSDENDRLTNDKYALEAEISRLKSEIDQLIGNAAGADSSHQSAVVSLSERIAALEAELSAKDAEIGSLEADIARYQTVFTIDVREQARRIEEIVEYIETACPYVRMVDTYDEKTDTTTYKWVRVEELEAEAKAEALKTGAEYVPGERLDRDDVFRPSISVYYEDLATGYHFDYEADKKYDPASVVKAPFVMALLEQVSKDEQKYLDQVENGDVTPEKVDTDGDGVPDSVQIVYTNPAYDLSQTVLYDRATMFKQGSGEIRKMADGTELSYLDFVKYAIEYSDNIAYNQLKQKYGYTLYYALARRAKANTTAANANYMTARDAGRLFKLIYEFTEEDERWGGFLKKELLKANHQVMIPLALATKQVMHKYGWDTDAYHDAGVVLSGDKPYVIAVFSDLDLGGDEINEYIRTIIQMIDKLHNGFYQ